MNMNRRNIFVDGELDAEIEKVRKELSRELQRDVTKVEASRIIAMRLKRIK